MKFIFRSLCNIFAWNLKFRERADQSFHGFTAPTYPPPASESFLIRENLEIHRATSFYKYSLSRDEFWKKKKKEESFATVEIVVIGAKLQFFIPASSVPHDVHRRAKEHEKLAKFAANLYKTVRALTALNPLYVFSAEAFTDIYLEAEDYRRSILSQDKREQDKLIEKRYESSPRN